MLTPKKTKFMAEYLRSLNATQSAIAAGYSKNGARQAGSRLLADVDVQRAIAEARPTQLPDGDEIIADLQRLKDSCMEPDETGKPRDATNAIRALDLLGRFRNLWLQADDRDSGRVTINIIRGDKLPVGRVIEAR